MYALGLRPRTRAKISASIQDQQASGFLLEVTLEQHVPSFQKGAEATEPGNPGLVLLQPSASLPALCPQFPPLWPLPVHVAKQQVPLSL